MAETYIKDPINGEGSFLVRKKDTRQYVISVKRFDIKNQRYKCEHFRVYFDNGIYVTPKW